METQAPYTLKEAFELSPPTELLSALEQKKVAISPGLKEIEDFLTAEEKEAAIRAAYTAKQDRMQREAYRKAYHEKITAPLHPRILTENDFFMYCQHRIQKEIQIDDDNRQVIALLCGYFTGIQENTSLDLHKGILLVGNVGTGKTFLMSSMNEAPHAPFKLKSIEEIAKDHQKNGAIVMDEYSSVYRNQIPSRFFGCTDVGLCIDDAGAENESVHYGNKLNIFVELITARYRIGKHNLTHVTSNLTISQFEETYGIRTADRLKEMFNVVAFKNKAKSRRI